MNTTTATPREIDTELAAISTKRAKTLRDRSSAVNTAHRFIGDRTTKGYGVGAWLMGDDTVLDLLTAKAAAGESDRRYGSAQSILDKITAADEQLAALKDEAAPLNAEHTRRGWSRFFLVAAAGGHIHSSTHCSTCNRNGRPTQFSWLPDLSGKSEAEAVEDQGARLCTVCFPDAPVEWTNFWELEEARKQAESCDGSGTRDWVEGTVTKSRKYADCQHCGTKQSLTPTNKFRKHKSAK